MVCRDLKNNGVQLAAQMICFYEYGLIDWLAKYKNDVDPKLSRWCQRKEQFMRLLVIQTQCKQTLKFR
jgi:hypothetical protein